MRKVVLGLCMVMIVASCEGLAWAQGGLDQRVSELSQQIATKMSAKQKTTIAVVEFTDLQGNVTDFGRFLAEELVTCLFESEKFKVIERQLLSKVIAEQKLSLTGVIDPASAKQLGKLLGVDAIVSGTVTNLAQSLKVNARLISTETGEIFAVASTEIFKDESVSTLMSSAPKTTTSSLSGSASSPNKAVAQKVTVEDFVFELESCRLTEGAVTCFLTIKNNSSEDRRLVLYTHYFSDATRLYDETGTEYSATKIGLGRLTNGKNETHVGNTLVPLVATRASIRFDDVSALVGRATLTIKCEAPAFGGGPNFRATFRSVQIIK